MSNDALQDWAEQKLGRRFRDPALLVEALTHTSLPGRNYQRLEFLGDRVLGLIIATWLYERHPNESEGKLNRRFVELVRGQTCAEIARSIGASGQIRLERTAREQRVNETANVLGDVCEALIGALYLDGGMAAARKFVRSAWEPLLTGGGSVEKDPKSALQEWAQGRGLPLPAYAIVGRCGPHHAPEFTVEVSVRSLEPVRATGRSRQEAEKQAAATLLAKVREEKE
ncbi:ribonuclease III [Pedomonas mirosovicensis]|uniref:ribonuclease III n=1 Tax=Pedomonas mirosovicensis TaxID=2908641 RepID=UPI00216837BE|nr:ribonuclease III [Pedomonas mirosovicensis]MCH8685544.1 ribonuclease III [Pedomonas mirosovicensis]